MSLSFAKEYLPDLEALSEEQMAAARAVVVQLLQPALPDVDLSPGTPTGDFVVGALAKFQAASEEANRRFMSDLDLSNVAEGLIYSCEFVKAFLGNFAVYDVENMSSFGLVRLVYTSPAERIIPRTTRFRFGSSDDWSLRMTNPDAIAVTLLPPGSSHPGDADTYVLSQTSANTWAVDLPVSGVLTDAIPAGASGRATDVPTDLVGISAAIKFLAGIPSATLSDLARMARKTAYSLTAGSRESISTLVYKNWPESAMVSPIVTGDPEMLRLGVTTALALLKPAVDLYYRSNRDMQRETQYIRLDYVQPTGGGNKVFRGPLALLHRPSRIVSLEWSGTTATSLVDSYQVFSIAASNRPDLYGSLYCGTRYEMLYAEVIPELDELDVSLIPRTDVEEDNELKQYAIFKVVYDTDPLLETVSATLESTDYRPVGVDVLVKSGPLVTLSNLTIGYTKKKGVKTALAAVRENIVEYMRQAGYPDPFRVTDLHDIIRRGGIDRITQIGCVGKVRVSAATRRFTDITTPGGDDALEDWSAGSVAFEDQAIDVNNIDEVVPSSYVLVEDPDPVDAWAATRRTVRFCIDPENISFIETA